MRSWESVELDLRARAAKASAATSRVGANIKLVPGDSGIGFAMLLKGAFAATIPVLLAAVGFVPGVDALPCDPDNIVGVCIITETMSSTELIRFTTEAIAPPASAYIALGQYQQWIYDPLTGQPIDYIYVSCARIDSVSTCPGQPVVWTAGFLKPFDPNAVIRLVEIRVHACTQYTIPPSCAPPVPGQSPWIEIMGVHVIVDGEQVP